ncbi:MAG: anaerobic ribonucleoside-triphosphate reductase activating protein [Candidatus Omnitrophica bacterium]|nr:anaerobic ribonucleoside-triphosphate reductase activating protein [Candidatus Omnitrophota bacterium]MBU1657168.1 anaerobic ribonucleoside-triphosphate reductase activating protein [Candidatus Omnitrophota bacterium]MBU1851813.1 anaerobic ribonucleoside-triphosphate reductase activating protein [Candidatus Omnitrophota bacterium]
MIIAGLQKLSLVDYPGAICSVVFTQGCNFRCGYCQNPDLIPPKTKVDHPEEEVLSFLAGRGNMIEGLVITGGEPTIHKDLPDFIKKVKDIGLKVKLDTNGAEPDLIERLLKEEAIDYIALDIKTALSRYSLVTDMRDALDRVSRTIRLIMLACVPYEFRTTCVPGVVDVGDLDEISKLVKGADKYCLQQFRAAITLDKKFQTIKPYTPAELKKFQETISQYVQRVPIRGV